MYDGSFGQWGSLGYRNSAARLEAGSRCPRRMGLQAHIRGKLSFRRGQGKERRTNSIRLVALDQLHL